nr:MAG TPA: hypothetical protein [Caudoviricetes sp.]
MDTHKYLYNPCPQEWKGKPFLSQENRQECRMVNSKHDAVNRLIHDVAFAIHDVARSLDNDNYASIKIKIRANDSRGQLESYWLKENNNDQTR